MIRPRQLLSLVLAAAFALAVVLVGCGPATPGKPAPAAPAPSPAVAPIDAPAPPAGQTVPISDRPVEAPRAPSTFAISGRIGGLAGTGLVLSTEGEPDLEVARGASTFAFAKRVAPGTPYAVAVKRRPSGPPQTCTVADGSGTAGALDARSVTITCVTDVFPVGGTVGGFAGSGLVLSIRYQGGAPTDLPVRANGSFKFPAPGVGGSRYEVTVKVQPVDPAQVCTVTGGAGTLDGPVTEVSVACVAAPPAGLAYPGLPVRFTKGVAVTATRPVSTGGAIAGWSVSPALPPGLTLDPTTGVLSGKPTALAPQATHVVTGHNESGSASASIPVTVVDVPPSSLRYPVNPADHRVGQPITANVPTITGGAVVSFAVSPPLPPGLSLDAGTGAILGTPTAGSPATAYTITAANSGGSTTASLSIAVQLYTVGGVATGVQGGGLLLSSPGQPDLAVPAGAKSFTFSSRVANGATYAVTVARQPSKPVQLCAVTSGAGTVGLGDVTSVSVRCRSVWRQVAGGDSHSVGVRPDGTLWTWGQNAHAQLGDGTTTDRYEPHQIGSGFAAAAAGVQHTLAIDAEGTLWGWGGNAFGQVGNGTREQQAEPRKIGTGFASVAAGYFHTLALKKDGTLWAWGQNGQGQLGDGTTTARNAPREVGSGFAAIAAGYQHSLGVKSDGSLWAWGGNELGQLGDGTREARRSPTLVGSGFTAVAAGEYHTVALKADGTVQTWGANAQGQLGDGSTTGRTSPRQVGEGFQSIAAGGLHSVAMKPDGSVWAWGYNFQGQVGSGGVANQATPREVGAGFASIAAGGTHTLARRPDGTLWAWGNNRNGQLGDGITIQQPTPKQVGTGFASVAVGEFHTLAVKGDGTLWAWGQNAQGQLGDGTRTNQYTPRQVGTGYAGVSAGANHSVALRTDGTLWTWGANGHGQLGDGTTADAPAPKQVAGRWLAAAAGAGFTVALRADGTVWAWGANESGQLGDRTTKTSGIPAQVGSGFTAVAAGVQHVVALKADGTIWAWGGNGYGQLGDGSTKGQVAPVQVGSGFTAVAAGATHTVGLKGDGSLWVSGLAGPGQPWVAAKQQVNAPFRVGGGYVSAEVGEVRTVARAVASAPRSGSRPGEGEKGASSRDVNGFASVAAGSKHRMALKPDGTLWAWGGNQQGQLGDGGGHKAVPSPMP